MRIRCAGDSSSVRHSLHEGGISPERMLLCLVLWSCPVRARTMSPSLCFVSLMRSLLRFASISWKNIAVSRESLRFAHLWAHSLWHSALIRLCMCDFDAWAKGAHPMGEVCAPTQSHNIQRNYVSLPLRRSVKHPHISE